MTMHLTCDIPAPEGGGSPLGVPANPDRRGGASQSKALKCHREAELMHSMRYPAGLGAGASEGARMEEAA